MREWPEAELFLADLPQAREAVWLGDQEEDDHGAEDHELEVLAQCIRDALAELRDASRPRLATSQGRTTASQPADSDRTSATRAAKGSAGA